MLRDLVAAMAAVTVAWGDGTPLASDEAIPVFPQRSLGFQIRYRCELAPSSCLYVACVRGGSLYDEGPGDPCSLGREFMHAFDLRDSEQLLVKSSCRFEV